MGRLKNYIKSADGKVVRHAPRIEGSRDLHVKMAQGTFDAVERVAIDVGVSRAVVVEAALEFCQMKLGEIVVMRVETQHQNRSYTVSLHDYEDGAGSTLCFQASCGECGAFEWVGKHKDMRVPPEVVERLFRNKGWHLGKSARQNLCAKCATPSTDKTIEIGPATFEFQKSTPQEAPVSIAAPTPIVRALTGAETRQISALLEEHFDEKNGTYDDKWDDQVIADKVNVPRACVAKLRIEGWGQIRSFPDIEALKSESIEFRKMLNEFDQRIKDAERKRLGA